MRLLSLAPLRGPGLEALRALGDIEIDPWSNYVPVKLHSADDLIARTAGTDILIVEADHVPGALFEARPEIRIVASCRADPVNIDIDAATRAGVPLVYAPGRNAEAVAELTVGLIYALVRGIVRADDDVRAGRWIDEGRIAYQRYRGREIRTLTVGLVGCGAVGQAVSRRLSALGARVLASDPFADPDVLLAAGAEPAPLEAMLADSDIVSVHAPLNASTRGLLGAAEIAAIKDGAFFVNTARFGIADEVPLMEALRSGRLAGAAFDHFPNEFLAADHPLLGMANVVLTPHIGGATEETEETMTTRVAEGIRSLVDGAEPVNVANPESLIAFAGRMAS
ncbi:MAG: NAD(P)-dependent oxidoreductase [Actinomycetota bacterium]